MARDRRAYLDDGLELEWTWRLPLVEDVVLQTGHPIVAHERSLIEEIIGIEGTLLAVIFATEKRSGLYHKPE
jgi:hypothetical protein